jgi:hypothetical protein
MLILVEIRRCFIIVLVYSKNEEIVMIVTGDGFVNKLLLG